MSDDTDLDLPELAGAETVGRITITQLDWWNAHPDAFSEAVAVIEWDELHAERGTVGPVIEERPPQRLTMTVEEAAVVLGISRASAYDAVSRGEIPCIRIGRRILIPKVALERLLDGAGRRPVGAVTRSGRLSSDTFVMRSDPPAPSIGRAVP